MYTLHFQNDYYKDVIFGIDGAVKHGAHMSQRLKGVDWHRSFANLHSLFVVWLGEEKIPGYELKGKYGLLFRTATTEIYSRFDGDVEFDLTLSKLGTYYINSKTANSIEAKIPEIILEQ